MTSGVIFGLKEEKNPWARGGFIVGELGGIWEDAVVALRTRGGACKVLYKCGLFERDYVVGSQGERQNEVVRFKVPAREFFHQPGHHTVELVSMSSSNPTARKTISRRRVQYYGPCVTTFSHCDLTVQYELNSRMLNIQGHYIGWRDPTHLMLSLPGGKDIPLQIAEADSLWLRDKPIWFSHHIICRFSERCHYEMSTESPGLMAILRAVFGGEDECVICEGEVIEV